MTSPWGFPDFNTLSALLLVGLLGVAVGSSWGRHKGREEADREAHEETERALQNTAAWHQRAQTLRRAPDDAADRERPGTRSEA